MLVHKQLSDSIVQHEKFRSSLDIFDIAYSLSVIKLTATLSEQSFLLFEKRRTILQMTTEAWNTKNVAYYRCQKTGIGNGEHNK